MLNNLDEEIYIRKIEKLTNLNVTICFELRYLLDNNIVDYKRIGKIKRFFFKNSFEARLFLEHVEIYKTQVFLSRNPKLKLKLKSLYELCDFVIFGSFANFSNIMSSDIDILIFKDKNKYIENVLNAFKNKVSVQYVNYDKFIFLLKNKNSLSIEVLKNHVLFCYSKKIVEELLNGK